MDLNYIKLTVIILTKNSGLVMFVDTKHKVKHINEIFIDKFNCLQLNISKKRD